MGTTKNKKKVLIASISVISVLVIAIACVVMLSFFNEQSTTDVGVAKLEEKHYSALADSSGFTITKKGDENILLPNAKFKITDLDGNPVQDTSGNTVGTIENGNYVLVTDASGRISVNLPDGFYKLEEIEAPEGYWLPGTQEDRVEYIGINRSRLEVAEFDIKAVSTIKGNGFSQIYDIKSTGDGGYVVAGSAQGDCDINADRKVEFTSKGDYDYVIAKFDKDGVYQWHYTDGTTGPDEFKKVDRTSDGGYIAVGYEYSDTYKDAVVVKVDSEGNLVWKQKPTSVAVGNDPYDDELTSVKVLSTGSIVVTGNYYGGEIKVGETVLRNASQRQQGFVAWLDEEGYATKAVQLNGRDVSTSVRSNVNVTDVIEANDNVVVSVDYVGKINVNGTEETTTTNQQDAMIVRFTLDGGYIGRTVVAGAATDSIEGLAVDEDGNIIAAGGFGGNITISGTTITPKTANKSNALMLKFTSNGNFISYYAVKGSDENKFTSVMYSSDGGIVLGGWFYGAIDVDGDGKNELTSKGHGDGLVFKIKMDGSVDWGKQIGGTTLEEVYAVAELKDRNILAAGSFDSDTLTVDGRTNALTKDGGTDTFVAILDRTVIEPQIRDRRALEIKNELKTFKITTEVGANADGKREGGTISGKPTSTRNINLVEEVKYGHDTELPVVITPDGTNSVYKVLINDEEVDFTPGGNGVVVLGPFENVKENYHIKVIFETQSTVLVHHYKEGTTEKLAEDVVMKDRIGNKYKATVSANVPEYYEAVGTPANVTGFYTSDQTVVTFYYKLRKYTYDVNYLDKDTGENIKPTKVSTISYTYGTDVSLSNEKIDIVGYNYDHMDKNSMTIGVRDNVVNIYYAKRRDLTLTVNYYEAGTSNRIKDAKTIRNLEYGAVIDPETYADKITGYNYGHCTPSSVTIGVNNNTVDIYYSKVTGLSYTVNFVEKGNETNVLHSPEIVGDQSFGDVISAESCKINIDGYRYVNPSSETITLGMNDEDNVITLYYTKRTDLSYTLKFYDVDTYEQIHTDKTVGSQIFESVISAANAKIDIDGYRFERGEPTSLTISSNSSNNIIRLYYLRLTGLQYTVRYVEKGNSSNVLHEDKVDNEQTYGNVISAADEVISIDGYNYDSASSSTITIGTDANENVITLYYTRRADLSYTVNYLEKDTERAITSAKTVNRKTFGDTVRESAIAIEGYDKVNPTEKTITIGVTGNVINFYYTKRTDLGYTVNYLEKDTNTVLANSKYVDGQMYDASVSEEAITIAGYNKPAKDIETIKIGVNDNVINFYYTKRNDLSYTVKYYDLNTDEELKDAKVVNNQTYKSRVSETADDIAGYDKVAPTSQSIIIGLNENVIKFYYTKRTNLSYTVNYLEKDTETVLADSKTIANQEFESRVTESAINIEGYDKVAPTTQSIIIGVEENVINFYYTKRVDLSYTVNYLEKGTGKVLNIAKTVDGQEFKKEITENAIDIVGYNLDGTAERKITIGVTGNVINFYYTKKTDLQYTVRHIEDGTDNEVYSTETIRNQTFEKVINASDHVREIDGFKFKSANPTTLTVGVDSTKNVITIYYSRVEGLSYTVNYLEKGSNKVISPAQTTDNQVFGTKVNARSKVIDVKGYKFDSVSTEELTVGTGENVLNIYYTVDADQTKELSYTVEYYRDGVLMSQDTQVEKTTVQWLQPDTMTVNKSKINTTNKYVAYVLDTANTAEIPNEIASGSVIKVYYKRDLEKTGYTIEYYYDGARDDAATELVEVDTGHIVTESEVSERVTAHNKDNYKLLRVTNTPLVAVEDMEGNIIRVYYIKKTVGPGGEDIDKDKTAYTIEYYYEGVRDNDRTLLVNVNKGQVITDSDIAANITANTKEGYKLLMTTNTPLTVTEDVNSNIIRIYYIKSKVIGPDGEEIENNKVGYSVEYYYNGVKDNYLTDVFNADVGSTITDSMIAGKVTANTKEGYKLLTIVNTPLTIVEDVKFNVIRVYYKSNKIIGPDGTEIDNNKVGYTIEYYYNAVKDNTRTELVDADKGDVITKATIANRITANTVNGYKLLQVLNTPLTITEDIKTNVIRVYYKSNKIIGPGGTEIDNNKVGYSIEYYYNGTKDNARTELIEADKNAVITDSDIAARVTANTKDGFKLLTIVNTPLTTVEDMDANVIKVYYISEKITGPDGTEIDNNKVGYSIEYYYNGVKDNARTELVEATKGNIITDSDVNARATANTKDGFRLLQIVNTPLTTSEDVKANVIKVFYISTTTTGPNGEIIPNTNVGYSIEYFYNGVKDNTRTDVIEAKKGAIITDSDVAARVTANTKDGFKLLTIVNTPLTTSDNMLANVVRVYYINKKVTGPDGTEIDNNKVGYTMEYFYDGIRDNTLTEVVDANKGQIITDSNIENRVEANTRNGFKLLTVANTPLVTSDDMKNNVIRVYYISKKVTGPDGSEIDNNKLGYTMEYFYNGVKDNTRTELVVAAKGDIVNDVNARVTANTKDGFKLLQVVNMPLTVSENMKNNVIKVYYINSEIEDPNRPGTMIPNTNVGYSIEYFYNGVKDNARTDVVEAAKGSIITNDTVANTVAENRLDGYTLLQVLNTPLTVIENIDSNVIRVYYKSDLTSGPNGTQVPNTKVGYSLEYYYNGVRDYSLTELVEVEPNTTITNETVSAKVAANTKAGFKLLEVVNTPLTASENVDNNVIKIFYVDAKVQDPENPGQMIDNNKLGYTIEYYYNGDKDNRITDLVTADRDDVITEDMIAVNIAAHKKAGCTRVVTLGLPLTIGGDLDKNVVRVYYVDSSVLADRVQYQVKYYYDGVVNNAKTSTVADTRGNVIFEDMITELVNSNLLTGYELSEIKNTPLVLGKDILTNVIEVYYVKRADLSYTVNYYEKDTTTSVADSKVAHNKVFGDLIKENAIDVPGYDKVNPISKSITIGVGENIINFYYTKREDLSYTVNYLEKDTEKVIAKAKVVNGQTFGTMVEERAIDIAGYVKPEVATQSIEIGVEGNVIDFYYTKRSDLSYVVNHYEDGTTTKIADTEKVTGVEFETVIDSKTKAEEIDGYSFKSCNPESLIVGVDTENNVIDIFYTRVSGLSYTVNYVEKGNEENVLHPAKQLGEQVFGTTIKAQDEVIDITGYNYDSVSVDSIRLETDSSKNVITIYYTKKADLSYTVNYYEKDTNNKISDSKVVDKQTFEAEITEKAIDIVGYVKPETDTQTIVIGVEENVINFYYVKRKDLSYTVNYYEEGTTQKVAESKVIDNQVFKAEIRETPIEVSGYDRVSADSKTIIIGVEGNVIDFYYTKRSDLSYVVNYYEKDTDKKITASKNVSGQIYLSDVTEQAMPIEGYVADGETSKTIRIGVDTNVIDFYYVKRKDLSYTVDYLEKGTTKKIAESKIVEGQTFESDVTEQAIDIAGYDKQNPITQKITIGVSGNVISFYYTKKIDLSYTVNYLEKDTENAVATAKVVHGQTFDADVTEQAIDVDGYNKVDPTEASIKISDGENVINFYYTKKSDLGYKVNYLEKNTDKVLAEQKNVSGKTFDEVIKAADEVISIDGYNYNSVDKDSIRITTGENIINIYYVKRKDLSYKINYLEKDTNAVLRAQKAVSEVEFDTEVRLDAEKVTIDGYVFDSAVPENFRVGTNIDSNVMNIYYVKRADLSYTINYLDSETRESLHDAKVQGNQVLGTKINANDEIIDIDGYEFESVDKMSITIRTGENVINIYYARRKDLTYTMNFLEKGTNEVLADAKVVRGQTFEAIVSSSGKQIEIDGYNYDSVDKRTLTIGTGVNEFNFYYTKRNDLTYTVNYLEQGSNKALASAKVVNEQEFKAMISEKAIDIVGYVKPEVDSQTIEMKVEGNVINFYYTKRNDLSYVVNHYEDGTTKKIADSETIEGVTFEMVIDSKTKAKTIDGYSFKSCTPESLTIGVDLDKNVINIYYARVDGLSYTVNYVEKGNETNILHPAKVVDKQTFGNVITAADEIIDISGYNYDSVSADTITVGTDATKNVITIYYTRRVDLSYTVNYLEQGTEEVLATAKTVDKQVLGAEVTETAIDINGYVKPETDTQKIVIAVEGNVINFYYTKKADLSYTVNYYEEGTVQKVAESKVVDKQIFNATVKEEAIDVPGYAVVDPATQSIVIAVEGNVINFYYTRRVDLGYVVNYLEKDTDKKVIPSKNVTGQTYLSDVTEQAMPVEGYDMVEPTSNTITIGVSENVINFYYTKRTNLSYTVNYLEKGATEPLAPAKVVDGQTFETKITEEAIDIAGYVKPDVTTQEIEIAIQNNVINFYYTKRNDLSYIVNYLEFNTENQIANSKRVDKQTFKATASEEAINIDGYDKLDPTTKSIVIAVEGNVINFYYTKKGDLNYKVNYLEKDTNKVIRQQKVDTGRTFDEVIIAADEVIDIDGYNYDSRDKETLKISTGENVINLYYTKKTDLSYTVNYLEKDTNKVLKAQKVAREVAFDTEVTIAKEKLEIDGYIFDSAIPESFNVGTNIEANVMNIYYRKRSDLSYTVNYLETETNTVLQPAKVTDGKKLEDVVNAEEEIVDIDGYNFDSFSNATIVIGTGENVINIYYTKRNDLTYTINYLEKDTNEVLHEPTVVRNQVFGAVIGSSGKSIVIDGYNYNSADKRTITIGTNEAENVINLYYTKFTDLTYTVKYIDRDTDKVLADDKTVSNNAYGDVIIAGNEAIAIDGYSFDGCNVERLTIGTGENVIIVYYTKVEGLSYTVKYIDKITDETINAPKTKGDQTFGDTILARNERIDIDGYVYDSASKDRLTIGTGVNELIIYYTKRTDLSYKVRYVEKGTGKEIKSAKVVTDKMFKEEVFGDDEAIDIDGYNIESVDKEKIIIGTNTDENVITVTYARRTDLGYVVNYLEKGTNKPVTGSKTVENITFGSEIYSANDKIKVYGYDYDSADKESIIIGTGENVINLYFTLRDTKVTVHYYEENTTNKVSEDVVFEGKVFTKYETEAARDVASKYELVGIPENATGKMTEEEMVVNYYYRKKATKVIVHFYEEGTTNKLSENVVIDGRIDDGYTTTAATDVPAKYELSIRPENATGSMTEEIIEVTYFYKVKDAVVNVRYLEKDTNIELASSEKQTGKVEEDYRTDAKSIEGYTLVGDSGNTTGKLTIDPITVTFYYLQNTSVQVNHIDKNTGEIIETDIAEGLVGDKYTASAKNIENYMLVERPRIETVTMSKDKITLNYYYVHVSAGVIEKHVDVITGDILANEVHDGHEGDEYEILARIFEGYDLVTEKLPANARGTMAVNVIEVTYYYKHRASVTVEYVDKVSGKKLAEDVVIDGHEADKYTTDRKEFDGYVLKEMPGNADGAMTKENITVRYEYVHASEGVEVKYIDIKTGEELAEADLIAGNETDDYKAEARTISGYDLVKDKLPENAEGNMTVDKIVVEYYYIRRSGVTVKYVDKSTGDLVAETEVIEGHEGDAYKTESKDIEGYKLVKTPENNEGTMGRDMIEVIYEYARPAKVVVNYIDVDTNDDIMDAEEINGFDGDAYEVEVKEIKYYNLVQDKLPNNAKGTMKVTVTDNIVDNTIVVNYFYKKMTFSLKVNKVLDSVVLNGKTLSINSDIGKIDIDKTELANAKLQIIYKIRVTNDGELAGKAKLLENLPKGTTMSKADNQLWEVNGATATMITEEIKPGETKEYTVILDWVGGENNLGNMKNTVDVIGTENEAGFPAEDVKVDLKNNEAELVISISTGTSTYVLATGIVMIVLAGVSIILVKKTKE